MNSLFTKTSELPTYEPTSNIFRLQTSVQSDVRSYERKDYTYRLWGLLWGCHGEREIPREDSLQTHSNADQRHGGNDISYVLAEFSEF